jgi:hypothetical protein
MLVFQWVMRLALLVMAFAFAGSAWAEACCGTAPVLADETVAVSESAPAKSCCNCCSKGRRDSAKANASCMCDCPCPDRVPVASQPQLAPTYRTTSQGDTAVVCAIHQHFGPSPPVCATGPYAGLGIALYLRNLSIRT